MLIIDINPVINFDVHVYVPDALQLQEILHQQSCGIWKGCEDHWQQLSYVVFVLQPFALVATSSETMTVFLVSLHT